jgi:hypothetical protein
VDVYVWYAIGKERKLCCLCCGYRIQEIDTHSGGIHSIIDTSATFLDSKLDHPIQALQVRDIYMAWQTAIPRVRRPFLARLSSGPRGFLVHVSEDDEVGAGSCEGETALGTDSSAALFFGGLLLK